jgi:hypothetical protein
MSNKVVNINAYRVKAKARNELSEKELAKVGYLFVNVVGGSMVAMCLFIIWFASMYLK